LSEYAPSLAVVPFNANEKFEADMVTKEHGHIVETPTEARSAEPGPSVLALLVVSTIAAVFTLAIVWFVFFRT
jgi:hypothetical protein